jgi:hypothetical protein
MRLLKLALLLLLAPAALAAPAARPYHLELQATPAAAFPFFSRWGTVDLHVYRSGVRANALWLNAFAKNETSAVTVLNPLGRMYVEVPIRDISSTVAKLAGNGTDGHPTLDPVISRGKVKGIDAARYRLRYGPEAWIDVWTTGTLGDHPQYRQIVRQLVAGISPSTAPLFDQVPGIPLYVELNFRSFRKVPLLTVKKLTLTEADEKNALTRGSLYVRASMLESFLGGR